MNFFTLNSLPSMLREAISFRDLAAGQTLFYQDTSASALFVVETGRVKLMRHTPEHRPVTLGIARPGESFAESALFADFYPYGAIAEVASQVIVYPKQLLLVAIRDYPNLAEEIMMALIRHNDALVIRLELRDIRVAHTRVLQYLHYLAGARNPKVVSFDRPFKDVATDIGLAPETLSRALTKLERRGAITRAQNLIALHDSGA